MRTVHWTPCLLLLTSLSHVTAQPNPLQVRLDQGDRGRLILDVYNVSGVVCPEGFNQGAARVICFMLGFGRVGGMAKPKPSGNISKVWLSRLSCQGQEITIRDCRTSTWGQDTCDGSGNAAVQCACPPVPTIKNGRQSPSNNRVGSVIQYTCDSGYTLRGNNKTTCIQNYPNIEAPQWDGPAPECDTSLVRLEQESSGRLLLHVFNETHIVCPEAIDLRAAQVICFMLGFGRVGGVVTSSPSIHNYKVWLYRLYCSGHEIDIRQCLTFALGHQSCTGPGSAAVQCTCPPVPEIENGRPNSLSTQVGSVVNYICDTGYVLSGMNPIRCVQNATTQVPQWDRPAPRCNNCGIRFTPKLFGGRTTSIRSWPWMAPYLYFNNFGCGGSLIAPQWVLTSAHCISNPNRTRIRYLYGLQVLLGTTHLDRPRMRVSVSRIVMHPAYNYSELRNDVALLQLSQPVAYNAIVHPVCLADENSTPSGPCYIAGWGYTHEGRFSETLANTLNMVQVPIVTDRACARTFSNFHRDIHICAGFQNGTGSICGGDSGGPLMCQRPNEDVFVQYGVVTAGRECNRTQLTYSFFNDVRRVRGWIDSVIYGQNKKATP